MPIGIMLGYGQAGPMKLVTPIRDNYGQATLWLGLEIITILRVEKNHTQSNPSYLIHTEDLK